MPPAPHRSCMLASSIVFFLAVLAACGAVDDATDDPLAMGHVEQAIVNGTVDQGHPTVGKLLMFASGATTGSLCTGTLVGYRTVVTAAHSSRPRTTSA